MRREQRRGEERDGKGRGADGRGGEKRRGERREKGREGKSKRRGVDSLNSNKKFWKSKHYFQSNFHLDLGLSFTKYSGHRHTVFVLHDHIPSTQVKSSSIYL